MNTAKPSPTRREIQVLDLLIEGASNDEIADAMKISHHTARFHLRRIMAKMKAKNRWHLAAMWASYKMFEQIGWLAQPPIDPGCYGPPQLERVKEILDIKPSARERVRMVLDAAPGKSAA